MVDIEGGGFIQFYLRRVSFRGGGIATNAHIKNHISKLKSSQTVCDK